MTKFRRKAAPLLFAAVLPLFAFSGCEKLSKSRNGLLDYSSFLNIPGITDEEINAIEQFQALNVSFIYGMTPISEAFQTESGEFQGFAVLFCDWLTEFFGIPFTPALYDWDDLLAGLESGDIAFTGELTATDERRKTYIMTDAIAGRTFKSLRVVNAAPLEEIALQRPLRYIFLRGSTTADATRAVLVPDTYETLLVDSVYNAYDLLQNGEADLFVNEGLGETDFSIHGDFVTSDFSPVIFETVSMSTQTAALEPFISVVQKMLDSGGIRYLTRLYNQGDLDYVRYKMHLSLNEEELAYIQKHPVVRFGAERDNYPISFYNTREKQWQGIIVDVLNEVEAITGIQFERVNDEHTDFPALLRMLQNGEVSMISELIRSDEREGKFLWPRSPIFSNNYALLSKTDLPNIKLNEILYARVGLIQDTAHATLFKSWFPYHMNTVEYENADNAFAALSNDEVDMVMARQSRLLDLLNYRELVGYKTNILFDEVIDSTFGFHKDEAVLCSIVDKALQLIDTRRISEQWIQKTYDYRTKVVRAQIPWLIGAVTLLLCVLILVFILFRKTRYVGKRLESLVQNRTIELRKQNMLMGVVNDTAALLMDSDVEDLSGAIDQSMEMICQSVEVDRVYLWQNILKDDGKLYFRQVCKWMNTDALMDKTLQEFAYEDTLQSWEGLLSQGEILNGPLDTLPEGEKAFFEVYNIQSLLVIPLFARSEFWGFVSLDDCRRRRIFPQGEAFALRSWGLLTVGAIQRGEITLNMKQALIAAETASVSKSRFLANMSHEIRTPMNAILGIAEIHLQKEMLEPPMKEALTQIYDSGDLLLNIINDILDLSKIEAGKLALTPAKYDVASLINDTVSLIMVRMGSKPIELLLSVNENIPATLIGDKLRIKQILNNLLSNAFKYTTKGTITLSVSAEQGDGESGVRLICSISDTGQGMTEDQIHKLFNEYYVRFNMEANRSTEGTGLGLSITHNLVKLMNGEIFVESEPNRGSTFTVHLPQQTNGAGLLGRELAESLQKFEWSGMRQTRKAQIVFEPMPYGKVLVVDDVESNLYVAKGLMAPYGLTIDTAMNGFDAVTKISGGEAYDIIFMDHMMPVMDGIETAQKIRGMGYAHPIVALTANAVVGQSDIFMESGFDGFISKPIDIRQLDTELKKFVRDKQPPEIIEAANRQKSEYVTDEPVTERLAEVFVRDALRAIETLEAAHGRSEYDDNDIRSYTITAHAMRSALANVGEHDLSAIAFRLEEAGRAQNTAIMRAETLEFIDKLRAVVEKLTPQTQESPGDEIADDNLEYLQESLAIIKAACEVYDRKTAKTVITELREKSWRPQTRELLEAMAGHLLDGDFKEIEKLAGGILQ